MTPKHIDALVTNNGLDPEIVRSMKKPKKTKKNLDDIIQRLEKQVKRLQDGGD